MRFTPNTTATVKSGLNELRAVVVDKTGAVVWTDRLTPQDEAFKKLGQPDPMRLSVLLVEQLSPQLGLNEETAKAAKPGKMAALMDQRSGLPPESGKSGPARTPEGDETGAARRDAAGLSGTDRREQGQRSRARPMSCDCSIDAGLCKAVCSRTSRCFSKLRRRIPNELKTLWSLAREFRNFVRANPPGG